MKVGSYCGCPIPIPGLSCGGRLKSMGAGGCRPPMPAIGSGTVDPGAIGGPKSDASGIFWGISSFFSSSGGAKGLPRSG